MYEFQMLYGVTPKLRQGIVDKGYIMRVMCLSEKNGSAIRPAG